jgi:hypothetical protein
MATLMTFVRYESGFLLTALAAIIVYKLLTGRIKMSGVLSDDKGAFSPARLQLFLFTIATGFDLLSQITTTGHMPVLDQKLLIALFGSHSIYLGGKTYSVYRSNVIQAARKISQ